MRRVTVLASIMVMLAVVVPARAGGDRGYISMATANPAVPRSAWEANRNTNGVFGWVFRLDAGADDATYSMEVLRGATGGEMMDVYFYEATPNGRGIGQICPVLVQNEDLKTESGVICPGPRVGAWGIAVLVTGADARFAISY